MKTQFFDRADAGRQLAKRLEKYANHPGVLVLALPRGGVPVAYEVAQALHAPLDVFVVRKLGVPGHTELAMGAIATAEARVLNRYIVDRYRIPPLAIDEVAAQELRELQRRESAYHSHRPPMTVRGQTIILVDDGIATGATMRAAVKALRQLEAGWIVVACPTAALSTVHEMEGEVDEFVAVITPEYFTAVGQWYKNFQQTTDEEVIELLEKGNPLPAAHAP